MESIRTGEVSALVNVIKADFFGRAKISAVKFINTVLNQLSLDSGSSCCTRIKFTPSAIQRLENCFDEE